MKVAFFWGLAIILTIAAIIYQRKTGPTYDKEIRETIGDTSYEFELIRSHGGETDAAVELTIPDRQVSGKLLYRIYPTAGEWTRIDMKREGDQLSAALPLLPHAGKYEYKINLEKNNQVYPLNNGQPVIIRFKGDVPSGILIPHIIFMFLAMLLSNLAGIMAVFKYPAFKTYVTATVITLFIGGLILGPWVQWYAFDEAWAGVPFAWDLTDNKTLVAFLFWLLAFFMNLKKRRPVFVIIAAIVMLLVYSIPHSMYGSQLDPETGKIIQGWILVIN